MNINLETRYTILESDRQQFHYEPRNESAARVCVCVSLNALRMAARLMNSWMNEACINEWLNESIELVAALKNTAQ